MRTENSNSEVSALDKYLPLCTEQRKGKKVGSLLPEERQTARKEPCETTSVEANTGLGKTH